MTHDSRLTMLKFLSNMIIEFLFCLLFLEKTTKKNLEEKKQKYTKKMVQEI
jgi:hypothetical protein